MTKEIVKALKAMQESINDAIKRLDHLNGIQHTDNADQISDLQDLVLEDEYEKVLKDLDIG